MDNLVDAVDLDIKLSCLYIEFNKNYGSNSLSFPLN